MEYGSPYWYALGVSVLTHYCYEYRSLEIVKGLNLEYLISIVVYVIGSILCHPEVMYLVFVGYMMLCSEIIKFAFWEYVFLHPFIWSYIQFNNVDIKRYFDIMTVRIPVYTLQHITPNYIWRNICVIFLGTGYVFMEKLKQTIDVDMKYETPYKDICLHCISSACGLLLLTDIPTSVDYTDVGQMILIGFMLMFFKICNNLYAINFVVSSVFVIPYYRDIDKAMLINRCMFLLLKESIYSITTTHVWKRSLEHLISFSVMYFIKLNWELPKISIIVLSSMYFIINNLLIYRYHRSKIQCPCSNV